MRETSLLAHFSLIFSSLFCHFYFFHVKMYEYDTVLRGTPVGHVFSFLFSSFLGCVFFLFSSCWNRFVLFFSSFLQKKKLQKKLKKKPNKNAGRAWEEKI